MIKFYKYQGAGNDFVLIDNTKKEFQGDKVELSLALCDRKFGVGSDGLIFIENDNNFNFLMDFYNPDGSQSFCGNGSRCAVKFAFDIGVFDSKSISFKAIDGIHEAFIIDDLVKIQMNNIDIVEEIGEDYFINTGSPHYISYEESIDSMNMIEFGRQIRYSESYKTNGTNVNAVEILDLNHLAVRTYERGVEDETLACGTGVTACALSYGVLSNLLGSQSVKIKALGGDLTVDFERNAKNSFNNIWLTGPAEYVFKGEI
jgi:diaminopimelate epimerase